MEPIPPLPLFDTLDYLTKTKPKWEELPFETVQIRQDHEQALNFLHSYRGSQATFNAYRREIERFLHWCWLVAKKSLKEIRRADIETYIEFCQGPPKTWIGVKNVERFIEKEGLRIANSAWRPFVASISKKEHRSCKSATIKSYVLSQSALQAVFSILGSFFSYLIQEEYGEYNPVGQIRQKSKYLRKRQGKIPIRRLSELQWFYVIATAELMAEENPVLHERTLFIMTALFAMYLRVSELAISKYWTPQMGHFYRDIDGNWWFKTVGKGNKERDIVVSDAMLNALKRYRCSLNLTALPSPGETIALIQNMQGKAAIGGTRHIRRIVQQCFDRTMIRLTEDGFCQEAQMLLSATVHWLRHTGISEDVKIRPREHVRDDAGHSSSAITDRYIDVELRARHQSGKKKLVKTD